MAEARDSGYLPRWLFHAERAELSPLARDIMSATGASGGEVIATTPDILGKLSGKDNPQTVVAVYAEHATHIDAIDRTAAPIWFVAQAMRDPGNLGTLLRTGDAIGAGGVILIDECVDPFGVEVVRASMGAIFTQQLATARWDEFLPWLREGPGTLAALALDGSQDYQAPSYAPPTFILVGNEAQGLPADYAAAADVRVRIPMLGRADSLNASVSAAVMGYEVLNQLRAQGLVTI